MRTGLVIGNWKMHGSTVEVEALLSGVLAGVGDLSTVEVGVCPPFVYLTQAANLLNGSSVRLGAQNCSLAEQGAHTGEVSTAMLADLGCRSVLIGHSERRSLYGETDESVVSKIEQVLVQNLQPVLCVGESLAQREAGDTLAVVQTQLDAVLNAFSAAQLQDLVVAYEPVWAIGTGHTATPEQAQEVHAQLRARLAEKEADLGAATRILYGGSVKASNANELFAQQDIDGGLIGGASLKADEFLAICQAAQ